MKQLKPLKMYVPEWDAIGRPSSMAQGIDRHEIHELVKTHAEKLGYPTYEKLTDEEWIVLKNDSVTVGYSHINHDGIEEIQWQDFLKLTPDDVEVNNYGDNYGTVSALIEANRQTTDRNEKAWEIIESLLQELISIRKYLKSDNVPLAYSKKYLKENDKRQYDLIKVADEFIKQAGNK